MMKKLDTYLNLCAQVYDLSKPTPPEDAYRYYRSYVKNAKGPILEPMCGSGRFLLPLLEEGFDIEGFDASEHMLEALHVKAKAKNLKPKVWKGFIQNLKKSQQYHLIFIPSGSFGLIEDLEEAKKALSILREHLTDDGILLFEGETHEAIPKELNVWRGSIWDTEDNKMILLNSLATLEGNICRSICKYELVDGNSILHTEIEDFKVRVYEMNELISMLKGIGFKNIHVMKAFDKEGIPSDNDEVILYECTK